MTADKDRITLIVNGQQRIVSSNELTPDGEISFDEVVKLAFDPPPSGQFSMFTVSYQNGAGRPPDGILYADQNVKVKEGTEFDVSHTDKS